MAISERWCKIFALSLRQCISNISKVMGRSCLVLFAFSKEDPDTKYCA